MQDWQGIVEPTRRTDNHLVQKAPTPQVCING